MVERILIMFLPLTIGSFWAAYTLATVPMPIGNAQTNTWYQFWCFSTRGLPHNSRRSYSVNLRSCLETKYSPDSWIAFHISKVAFSSEGLIIIIIKVIKVWIIDEDYLECSLCNSCVLSHLNVCKNPKK